MKAGGSMTEEEREMLGLAAKAAGYVVVRVGDDEDSLMLDGVQDPWRPLHDDGDALRLAVRLGMCVDVRPAHTEVIPPGDCYPESEEHENDPEAATRRAIVRAAAEIGRAM